MIVDIDHYNFVWWSLPYTMCLLYVAAWFKAVQGFAIISVVSALFTVIVMLLGRCSKSLRSCGDGTAAVLSLVTGRTRPKNNHAF